MCLPPEGATFGWLNRLPCPALCRYGNDGSANLGNFNIGSANIGDFNLGSANTGAVITGSGSYGFRLECSSCGF